MGESRGSGGRSPRTAAAPQGTGPLAARSARPDPCHGPPRSPSRRRPRPPHPKGQEGPRGAARTAATSRGSATAPGAPGKGRWSRRCRGLTGLPPLPGTAVPATGPAGNRASPHTGSGRGKALSTHRWGVARSGERRGGWCLWLCYDRAMCCLSQAQG